MKKVIATILLLAVVIFLFAPTLLYGPDIEIRWQGDTVLVETNAYGGAATDLAADQAYDLSAAVDLGSNGYEGVQVTFEYDSAGTTDDIIISVFASLDGTNVDDIEYWSMQSSVNGGTDTQVSFLIRNLKQFKIGVKTAGTTDTYDYQITYSQWNWEYN